MSFKVNDYQQLKLDDPMWNLTAKEKRMFDKSWAIYFAENIFPRIDENKFACLYSDKASRPNTPVNICMGALVIKELFNISDDELELLAPWNKMLQLISQRVMQTMIDYFPKDVMLDTDFNTELLLQCIESLDDLFDSTVVQANKILLE